MFCKQPENMWFHTSGGARGRFSTKGEISYVESGELRTTPRRYSTIGHFTLSDLMNNMITAGSLAPYGDTGLKEQHFVFLPNVNTRIDAGHKVIYPNTLQPAGLHFGRCK